MSTEELVYIEKYDVHISKSFQAQCDNFWNGKTQRENPGWYEDVYLMSELWKKISASVKAGKECRGCFNPATQAHHRSYHSSTMSGYYTGHIDPICKDCHDYVHWENGIKNGTKIRGRDKKEARWNDKIQEKERQLRERRTNP